MEKKRRGRGEVGKELDEKQEVEWSGRGSYSEY